MPDTSRGLGLPARFWIETFFPRQLRSPQELPIVTVSLMTLPANKRKLYLSCRNYIKHEDDLINFRLTWMLTIHGFLYATYGFSAQSLAQISSQLAAKVSEKHHNFHHFNDFMDINAVFVSFFGLLLLMIIISVVGLGISFSARRSISAANQAIRTTCEIFEQSVKRVSSADGQIVYDLGCDTHPFIVPALTGGGHPCGEDRGNIVSSHIPNILIFSWILSSLYDLFSAYYIWP